jgi:serine/threonine protein kinase
MWGEAGFAADMSPGKQAGDGGAAPSDGLASGTIVGRRYELLHALGRGGMGVVWAARHTETGEKLAVKFLRTGRGGAGDPDAVKRFLREARAAASVRHPHVVAIREVLELENGRPMIVMELLGGETLRERLSRSKRMSLAETAQILLPVASAVGTAHEQGIVHRDLKPDNIFLSRDAAGACTVKVLDFGIAKVTRVDEQASHSLGLTGTGEVLGTPNYMSPEQVFGERDIDQRADVWALGVILYECLSGLVPTKAANVGQVFKLIVAGGIRSLKSVSAETPAEIADLVDRMLARRREQRPFDLNEIARALAQHTDMAVPAFGPPQIRALDTDPNQPIPPEPLPNADETLKRGLPEAPESQSQVARRMRLGRLTTIGLGTLAVSVLVGESLLLWRSRSNHQPPAVIDTRASDARATLPDGGPAPPRP